MLLRIVDEITGTHFCSAIPACLVAPNSLKFDPIKSSGYSYLWVRGYDIMRESSDYSNREIHPDSIFFSPYYLRTMYSVPLRDRLKYDGHELFYSTNTGSARIGYNTVRRLHFIERSDDSLPPFDFNAQMRRINVVHVQENLLCPYDVKLLNKSSW